MAARQAKTTALGRGPETGRNPRWHWVYYILAAFNVLTLGISLSLNHRLNDSLAFAVQDQAIWSKGQALVSDLSYSMNALNSPGNDVFASGDLSHERERLLQARLRVDQAILRARQAVADDDSFMNETVTAELDEVCILADEIETAANRVFLHLENRPPAEAGAAMAAMDQHCTRANIIVAGIEGLIRDVSASELNRLEAEAQRLRQLEWVLTAMIGIMILAVTFYGQIVSSGVRKSQTELELASRRAEEANEAKTAFLANMSHEIRTPMTAILGFADLLAGPLSEREHSEAVATIRRNGLHLLEIVNDILDISKIESGHLTLEKREFSPERLAHEIVSLMGARAAERGNELSVAFSDDCPALVVSDPTRLKQALLNLMGNAIKFTENGRIELRISYLEGKSLLFEVEDDGIGIESEKLAMIFEPFRQADNSTSRRFGGTGLGLSITKRIAGLVGGDVEVVSEPGKGSNFKFRIAVTPAVKREKLSASEQTKLIPESIDARVLLVEDGRDNQRLISFLLKRAGMAVDIAENGQEGLDKIAATAEPYDIILSDMQMPIMDGYTMVQTLRQHGYKSPIFALTAHAMKEEHDRCLEAGCDACLSKPVKIDELLRAIADHITVTT